MSSSYPVFRREFFDAAETFTVIGSGSVGGKAAGLWQLRRILEEHRAELDFPDTRIQVPTLTVIATDFFDRFMERNGLHRLPLAEMSDDRIAHVFQQASLPAELVGDLQALVDRIHQPLAVRSSSMLEDDLHEPFAGIYATKMIPNSRPERETRFRRLVEAVKFVYASTYFRAARDYMRATGRPCDSDKMAVVIQEVVGRRHDERFYPDISGVGRSFSFYPLSGTKPQDGVIQLALGLGKTIVDGGASWSYCPVWPQLPPPFATPRDLMRLTQNAFWAVNMGRLPAYDPLRETEYLSLCTLADAERDGVIDPLASTYDREGDRLVPGTGHYGPRILTFAPLLELDIVPLNRVLRRVLETAAAASGTAVEIEFAVTLSGEYNKQIRLGMLQMRPMQVSEENVVVEEAEMSGADVWAATEKALGNGCFRDLYDVVYVKPENFSLGRSRVVAEQVEAMNRRLQDQGRPYVLIGFGRWGTSDPWLGIPVTWGQIGGARVIVEAMLPGMAIDLSQGAHFFHNLTAFRTAYLSLPAATASALDWGWLDGQAAAGESEFVRHVRLQKPLIVCVDGMRGRGVIRI